MLKKVVNQSKSVLSKSMRSKDAPEGPATGITTPAFNYAIEPELQEYTVPFAQYARTSPSFSQYTPDTKLAAATACAVYHKDTTLIVQRAPTDSMPLRWETPGGACDDTDASILDSAARELFEESGLIAKRMIRLLDRHAWQHPRVGLITKFVFEVEVEIEPEGDERPKVTLDPKEHCAYRWVTQEAVEATDEDKINFASSTVKNYVLAGFKYQVGKT